VSGPFRPVSGFLLCPEDHRYPANRGCGGDGVAQSIRRNGCGRLWPWPGHFMAGGVGSLSSPRGPPGHLGAGHR